MGDYIVKKVGYVPESEVKSVKSANADETNEVKTNSANGTKGETNTLEESQNQYNAADINKDGRVSRLEYLRYFYKNNNKTDSNNIDTYINKFNNLTDFSKPADIIEKAKNILQNISIELTNNKYTAQEVEDIIKRAVQSLSNIKQNATSDYMRHKSSYSEYESKIYKELEEEFNLGFNVLLSDYREILAEIQYTKNKNEGESADKIVSAIGSIETLGDAADIESQEKLINYVDSKIQIIINNSKELSFNNLDNSIIVEKVYEELNNDNTIESLLNEFSSSNLYNNDIKEILKALLTPEFVAQFIDDNLSSDFISSIKTNIIYSDKKYYANEDTKIANDKLLDSIIDAIKGSDNISRIIKYINVDKDTISELINAFKAAENNFSNNSLKIVMQNYYIMFEQDILPIAENRNNDYSLPNEIKSLLEDFSKCTTIDDKISKIKEIQKTLDEQIAKEYANLFCNPGQKNKIKRENICMDLKNLENLKKLFTLPEDITDDFLKNIGKNGESYIDNLTNKYNALYNAEDSNSMYLSMIDIRDFLYQLSDDKNVSDKINNNIAVYAKATLQGSQNEFLQKIENQMINNNYDSYQRFDVYMKIISELSDMLESLIIDKQELNDNEYISVYDKYIKLIYKEILSISNKALSEAYPNYINEDTKNEIQNYIAELKDENEIDISHIYELYKYFSDINK